MALITLVSEDIRLSLHGVNYVAQKKQALLFIGFHFSGHDCVYVEKTAWFFFF